MKEMRVYFRVLLCLCISSVTLSCVEPKIKMSFEGFSNDTVIMYSVLLDDIINATNDSVVNIDTLLIKNNRLNIPVTIKDGVMNYQIRFCETDDGNINYSRRHIILFAQSEECLRCKVTRGKEQFEYTVRGSALNEGLADYAKYVRPISFEIDRYNRGEAKNYEIINQLYDKRREKAAEWLRENQDSPAAMYVMAFEVEPDTLLVYYDKLFPMIEKSELRPLVEREKTRAEIYVATVQAEKNVREGAEAPQFTLNDNYGNSVSLASLRGKWVVLDFWGTWCGWCLKGISDMKRAYNKHKNRCEFVSIDCNESRESWLKGLEKYQMPWVHLYNPKDSSPLNSVSVKYAVMGYPTKIIITPEGRIHKIFDGETAEFYAELDRVVK